MGEWGLDFQGQNYSKKQKTEGENLAIVDVGMFEIS